MLGTVILAQVEYEESEQNRLQLYHINKFEKQQKKKELPKQ